LQALSGMYQTCNHLRWLRGGETKSTVLGEKMNVIFGRNHEKKKEGREEHA